MTLLGKLDISRNDLVIFFALIGDRVYPVHITSQQMRGKLGLNLTPNGLTWLCSQNRCFSSTHACVDGTAPGTAGYVIWAVSDITHIQ